jgi:HD-GYP domain-containing protein (c-di-GMP phosphodiesterase class II)
VYARRMGAPRLHYRARPRSDHGGPAKALASALLKAAPEPEGYGANHALAVAALSRPVGIELGLDKDALEDLESAALLHDLGKVGLPETILRKAGPLTREEAGILKAHPQRGARMVEVWPCLDGAAQAIKHHHERYDGGGYPEGLAGEQIPLAARIVAAADAYDVMVSGRPYQKPRPLTEVIGRLFAEAGAQFDARVVAALARVVL